MTAPTLPIAPPPQPDLVAMAWLQERWPAELGTIDPGIAGEVFRVRDEIVPDLAGVVEEFEFFAAVILRPGRTTRHEIIAPLDFHVFASTKSAAGDLAGQIDAELLGRSYIRTSTGESLQGVISRLSPVTVPWADAGVRRYLSSYTVTARR